MVTTFNENTIAELYPKLIDAVIMYGEECAPRQMKISELRGVTIDIADTYQRFISYRARDMNPIFPIVELMWYLSGSDEQLPVVFYAQKMEQYANPFTQRFDGAYGKRWRYWNGSFDQISHVVSLLQKDPDTRRAVLTTFDPILDSREESLDIPCNITFQFLLRQGLLHLHTYCRSQDVWYGLPNDMCEWMMLQHIVAGWLGVKPGHLVHNIGSLHLYHTEKEKAQNIIIEHFDDMYKSGSRSLDMLLSKEDFSRIAKTWYHIERASREYFTYCCEEALDIQNGFWSNACLSVIAYNARKHKANLVGAASYMDTSSDLFYMLQRWIEHRGGDISHK